MRVRDSAGPAVSAGGRRVVAPFVDRTGFGGSARAAAGPAANGTPAPAFRLGRIFLGKIFAAAGPAMPARSTAAAFRTGPAFALLRVDAELVGAFFAGALAAVLGAAAFFAGALAAGGLAAGGFFAGAVLAAGAFFAGAVFAADAFFAGDLGVDVAVVVRVR